MLTKNYQDWLYTAKNKKRPAAPCAKNTTTSTTSYACAAAAAAAAAGGGGGAVVPANASPADVRIHSIWKTLRGPFLLPEVICNHNDWMSCSGWEIYDFQAAGCRTCGCMHVCKEGVCPCEKNEEGQDICCITGCCIKMLNFSDKEFIDTACFHHAAEDEGAVVFDSAAASTAAAAIDASAASIAGKSSCMSAAAAAAPAAASYDFNEDVDEDDASQGESLMLNESSSSWHRRKRARCGSSTCSNSVSSPSSLRCSVNKKNRYRSWVHHRMQVSSGNNARNGKSAIHGSHHHARNSLCCTLFVSRLPPPPPSLPPPIGSGNSSSLNNNNNNSSSSNGFSCNVEDETENVRSLIEMYVWDVLCSKKWVESMKMEVVLFFPAHIGCLPFFF